MDELKDRLKEAMDIRNMKAVNLCEKTGIPKGAVSYYLAGKSKPKQDRIYLLSKALGINEAWLMGYDVPMERDERQKKSDVAVDVTKRLGSDEDFREVVKRNLFDAEFLELSKILCGLDPGQIASVKNMLGAFSK